MPTIYGSNVADTTLSTACQMSTTSGGTETSNTTTIATTSNPYAEIRSKGGASTAVASLPVPTGNGWIYYPGAGTFAAGNWSAVETHSAVSHGVNMVIRFYKYSSGTYTSIGSITGPTQTLTAKTTYTFSATAMSSVTLASGDGIYVDLWWFDNNANAGGDNPTNFISNSGTAGVANDMQVTTSTFTPAATTVSRTVPTTAALQSTTSRTITSTAALQSTNPRTIPTTAALQSTISRTIPATAAIANTKSRTIPSTAALTNSGTRTIPASAALSQAGITRTIPTTAALQSTGNARTIPTSAALLQTKSRTIPATTTLANTVSRTITTKAALTGTVARTIPASASLITTRSRTIPATTSLTSSAVFYASNVAQTLGGLTLSDQMSTLAGGVETSFTVTMPSSGTNSYVELLAQGGSSSSTPVLPSPTGKGWSINLAGNTILAGSWSSIFTLAKSGTTKTGATLVVRYYRRTMDGVYYPIGVSTLSSQSFSTTKSIYITPSALNSWPWQFVGNDTLYMDAFVWNGATAWASDVFTVYVSNSATQGVYNDGTIIAPEMISTPDGITCYVGATNFQTGDDLPIRDQSITIADAIDQRSIATLVGEDVNGSLSYQRAMPVQISDSDQGLLYTGAVNSDKVSKPAAGTSNAQLEHQLTMMDNHYLVDKRTNETNYLNWSSGDMVCDFIQSKLAQEGVTGAFALESDYTPTTFGQGTLSGTVATTTTSPFTYAPNTAQPPITSNTGDLELTRAGTQFTLTEQTTSDFSSGTLTNMTASGNSLSPTTQSALKVITLLADPSPTIGASYWNATSAGASVFAQVFDVATVKIWSGSKTIGTNDALNYDVWIASSSPAGQVGVDFVCSDGTILTTYANQTATSPINGIQSLLYDNAGYSVGVTTDLKPIAQDSWYSRTIDLTPLHGKVINTVNVFVAGTSAGTYTIYVKNIYLSSASGSPFLSTTATATQVNPPVITTTGGYASAASSTAIVAAYLPTASYRISPAHSISGVGLVQNSNITWIASLPQIGPGVPVTTNLPSAGSMLIFVSYDGTTWLPCINAQPLPGLCAGANVAGTSLYLREQFAAGPDPTAIPALEQVSITINSAANQTTTDVTAAYGNATTWNTGTYVATSPNSNGQLNNQALARTWSENQMFGQTFLPSEGGLAPGQQPYQTASGGKYTINIPYFDYAANDNDSVISRLDFLGTGRDFIIQYDFQGNGGGNGRGGVGLCYRTGNWDKATGQHGFYWSFGYYLYASWVSDDITLWCGTNTSIMAGTGPGNAVPVASAAHTFNTNTTYTIRIEVSGSSHKVYINNVLTLNGTDSTIMSGGGIGMVAQGWLPSGTVVATNASITNLTFTPSGTWTMLQGSGYWQSPSISLSALGTCGNTQLCWSEMNRAGTPQTSALVLASIDGGTTWNQCVNGATTPTANIPGLPSGTNVSGKSLLIRMIISGSSPLNLPIIYGLYVRVCGNYGTVTGTRISPALNLSPVGYVDSSNVMWNANVPTNTSLTVQTTQDLSTFHTVGNNGAGEALPYWTPQPDATQDLFATNTSANYTSTSKSGGSVASVTYTTTQSSLTLAGGSSALYLNNAISCADVDMLVDMDMSDAGGMVFRKVDASNFYEVGVYDASSSGGFTNQLRLYKVASGTRTLLGSASSIIFTRGTFHRPRVSMQGGLINVYWDGQCVQSYLDTSPLASGACGLRNDGGTSRYYQLWIQPLGTNLTGQVLYTKVTMTTTDPAMMPQLFTLVACVRGPSIATGATISQLHPITKPVSTYYHQEMDALTQASGDFFWLVDKWRQMHFGPRLARPGAFPVQSVVDPAGVYSGYLLYRPQVSVLSSADLFRNRETITNVSGLVTPPAEIKTADGSATSWTMGYPLYSAPVITVNGQPATVGLQGVDNNRQFYWQPGSPSISYDSSLPKLPSGTVLSFTYVGESPVNTTLNNTSSQTTQASLELNSGIVDEITSALNNTAAGMTTDQATTFAQGLLDRYGVNNTIELIGSTRYIGLVPGTTIPLFLPEMMDVWNAQLPIVKLTTTVQMGVNGLVWTFAVDATNGPNISNWSRMWRPK